MNKFLAVSIVVTCLFQALLSAQSNKSSSTPNTEKGVKKAIIKSKPEPDYPREITGVEADVSVRMILSSAGEVTNIEAVKVSPDNLSEEAKRAFIRESIRAASRIKFIPAMKDGRSVSQWSKIKYHFNL